MMLVSRLGTVSLSLILGLLHLNSASATVGGATALADVAFISSGVKVGRWGPWENCPTGEWATSFRVKENHVGTDKEGVTGIQLSCFSTGHSSPVTSSVSKSGSWLGWSATCKDGFDGADEHVQAQASGVDSAGLTRLGLRCDSSDAFQHLGTAVTGSKSNKVSCPTGKVVCGIRSKVLPTRGGSADDLGVVDVAFKCCSITLKIDGQWSEWSATNVCTKTCGGGKRNYKRACNNPSPKNGGAVCPGDASKDVDCNTQPCPIHGGLTTWTAWSTCTKTCGLGSRARTRTCSNPTPQHGGRSCSGSTRESTSCFLKYCPVNGNWGGWGGYGGCSAACGNGSKRRHRYCNNPAPAHGGSNCPGTNYQDSHCHTRSCHCSAAYRNVGGHNAETHGTGSWVTCQTWCQQRSWCNGWVHHNDWYHPVWDRNKCYLKRENYYSYKSYINNGNVRAGPSTCANGYGIVYP